MPDHSTEHRLPLSDPRVSEWMVDWTAEELMAAQLDAMLYGNVRVTSDGKYVPWRQPK